MIATYQEHHQPRATECPHNDDPSQPCTCKRTKNRKPFRRIRVTDRHVSHGIRPQLTIDVWPDGRIEIREHKRRLSVSVSAGCVYERALLNQARAELIAKRAARKNRRHSSV